MIVLPFCPAQMSPIPCLCPSECSDFSPGVSVLLLIFLCLEAVLFLTFTAVMFGTQLHSICNDETVRDLLPHSTWAWVQGALFTWSLSLSDSVIHTNMDIHIDIDGLIDRLVWDGEFDSRKVLGSNPQCLPDT